MTTLSSRLKAARKALHPSVTQLDVAKKFHLTPSSVSLWESGKTEPDTRTLAALSRWYGVSVDWLLGVSDAAPGKPAKHSINLVPVISAQSANRWQWDAPLELLQTKVSYPAGTAAAIVQTSESMRESVPIGAYVVIDKSRDVQTGDLVLIQPGRNQDPVLRRYVREGRAELYVADDTRFPSYKPDTGVRVIGVASEFVIRRSLH